MGEPVAATVADDTSPCLPPALPVMASKWVGTSVKAALTMYSLVAGVNSVVTFMRQVARVSVASTAFGPSAVKSVTPQKASAASLHAATAFSLTVMLRRPLDVS